MLFPVLCQALIVKPKGLNDEHSEHEEMQGRAYLKKIYI